MRCLALLVLCLVVATATAAQAQNNTVGFAPTVTPGLNTVKVSFTTPTPTTASVSTSVDKSFALTVLDGEAKKVHNITIRALAPATTYNIKVVATPAKGKPSVFVGSFATGAIGSVPVTVTRSGNKVLLNGVPFSPRMVYGYYCTTPDYVTSSLEFNINTLEEGEQSPCDAATLHAALANRAWWYSSNMNNQQQLKDLPELLAGSAGFFSANDPGSLLGCRSSSDMSLYNLVSQHSAKPVVSTIVVSETLTGTINNCLDASGLHALFWVTFIAQGQGIEYYAHGETGDLFSAVSGLATQATQDGNTLSTLQPAILGGKSTDRSTDGSVVARVWQYGGVQYIIAENTSKKSPSSATFTFSGTAAKAKTASVLWEGRSVKLVRGMLSDEFKPLEIHIYKVVTPTRKKK